MGFIEEKIRCSRVSVRGGVRTAGRAVATKINLRSEQTIGIETGTTSQLSERILDLFQIGGFAKLHGLESRIDIAVQA